MKNFFIAAVLTISIPTLCAARTTISGDVDGIPFSFEKGFVIVSAKIKGKLPVDVVLSTGAEHSSADASLLEKYKLRNYYDGVPPITGGNDRVFMYSVVPDVSVGGTKVTSINMRSGSTSVLSKSLGREIFGILGADFFRGLVAQFDFKKKVVRFLDESLAGVMNDKKGNGDDHRRITLPMVESSDFLKRDQRMPFVENVSLNGKKVNVLLDTGMVTVMALSSSTGKKLNLAIPPEKGAPRTDKIDSVRLGDHEIKNVPAMLYAKNTDVDQMLSDYGVVFGSVFLHNFVVTFDFRKNVVLLEHV